MKKKIIGIVDFSYGNHDSLSQIFKNLGFNCFVSSDQKELGKSDLLILPGVGAFKPAMLNLKSKNLDRYLINSAHAKRPILGICLGMQLLASWSEENVKTSGLDIIPGRVKRLVSGGSHIGWNNIVKAKSESLFTTAHGNNYYFNHSYEYECSEEYVSCTTSFEQQSIVAAIKLHNVVGLQFHPEKSQGSGMELLQFLLDELTNA